MPGNTDTSCSLANVLASPGQLKESEHWYLKRSRLIRRMHQLTVKSPDCWTTRRLIAMSQRCNTIPVRAEPPTAPECIWHSVWVKPMETSVITTKPMVISRSPTHSSAQLRFDIRNRDGQIDRIIQAFPAKLFDQFAHAGNTTAKPIFILGMPRPGTSLVEQILASHS